MPDLSKLPKWAQTEFRLLEQEITALRHEIALRDDAVGDSDTAVRHYGAYTKDTRPLGVGPSIRFGRSPQDYFEVRWLEDAQHLEVRSAWHGFFIEPHVSNVIYIKHKED